MTIDFLEEEDSFVAAIEEEEERGFSPAGERGPQVREAVSLHSCIEAFTTSEELSEGIGWKCEKCSAVRPARKRFALSRLPPVLVMHLKRFKHTATGPIKVAEPVEIPLQLSSLELQPFCTPEAAAGAGSYRLYGVVLHLGGYGRGHYVATVRHRKSGKWYCCDDGDCYSVDQATVLTHARQRGYVLFYARDDSTGERYEQLLELLRQDQKRGRNESKIQNGASKANSNTGDASAPRRVSEFELDGGAPNSISAGQAPSWKRRQNSRSNSK